MSTPIPLSGAQPLVRIPLPIRLGAMALGGTTNATARQLEALRAVAAAAARSDLAGALKTAKDAKDNPGTAAANVDPALVTPVLEAVTTVQDDRSRAGTADEKITAVARAVGADPLLAAAALSAIGTAADKAKTVASCLNWVATVDTALLDRAATAERAQLVSIVPAASTGLKQLGERVDALTKRVDALEKKVP